MFPTAGLSTHPSASTSPPTSATSGARVKDKARASRPTPRARPKRPLDVALNTLASEAADRAGRHRALLEKRGRSWSPAVFEPARLLGVDRDRRASPGRLGCWHGGQAVPRQDPAPHRPPRRRPDVIEARCGRRGSRRRVPYAVARAGS